MERAKQPKPSLKHPHESTWDHHGSYQWTYFNEDVKQRIKFFLSERLSGKNIDLGGGWHLLYPNSTVVDLSSVSLSHNPASEKLHFDLDDICKGKKLPYENNSFDSATMTSVWQYLRGHDAIVAEIGRVLKPGAELYLINGQSGGLEGCRTASGRSKDIEKFFADRGFDTLREVIPYIDTKEFQSVCVSMPDVGLFGVMPSSIRNKNNRVLANEAISKDPDIFAQQYADWQMSISSGLLSNLKVFPTTKHSLGYLDRVEKFSADYHKETGARALVFLLHSIPQKLSMLTEESEKHLGATVFFIGDKSNVDPQNRIQGALQEKYGLRIGQYINYFDYPTIDDLFSDLKGIKSKNGEESYSRGFDRQEYGLYKYADFISAIPLTKFTEGLQVKMKDILKSSINDFDKVLEKRAAVGLRIISIESKGERAIDELVSIKERLRGDSEKVSSWGNFEFYHHLPHLRRAILNQPQPRYVED